MKRTQKSLKRIKLLLLLIILTTILAITATYAWFSSQRDVEITGMKINVEVAENMQISLDGEKWTQSIQIENMRQFYGTYNPATQPSFKLYQAKDTDNTNYVPTELKPVSTIGEVSGGKLQFVTGKTTIDSTGKSALTEITACSEADLTADKTVAERERGNESHPYLAFDMYLRNMSAKEEGDKLQLNVSSKVWVDDVRQFDDDDNSNESQEGMGKEGTGLENCVRVGFVPYQNTADITADGTSIRALTANNATSGKTAIAAIWEPNDKEHIQEVITNSKRGVMSNTTMPTYGIKVSAVGNSIDDVEATSGTYLSEQITMKPEYSTSGGTTIRANITNTANEEIMLEPNKITKIRVYIWLEGQDVDCINTASMGDRLKAAIKLTKPQNNDGIQNTYTEDGSGSGGDSSDVSNILTAATLTANDYGGYITNYSASNGANVNWRIFHSDRSNIYLITDDYVDRAYVPAGKNGTPITADPEAYARGFGMQNVINDYSGSADITASNPAKKWLSQYTYTSTNKNIKAMAYLMDTTVWSGFKDSTYAEYAIGGPTIELFIASYNAMHKDKTVETKVSGEEGYQIKWSSASDFDSSIPKLNVLESLYTIGNTTNAYAMWLASPLPNISSAREYLAAIFPNGNLGYGTYSSTAGGSRPIVSLKSSVQLEKQEDGKYKIVE